MLPTSQESVDIVIRLSQFILLNRTWDLQQLRNLLLDHIIQMIKGTPIPIRPVLDDPIWGPSSSGKFFNKIGQLPCTQNTYSK